MYFVTLFLLWADHRHDSARAENSLTLQYGSEPIGMQRDWNEELQSCREFPHTTPQERYLYFFTHNLMSLKVCIFSSFFCWWWLDAIYYLCFLGELSITAGFCGIEHFIKWHQTLLMQQLMVLLEWLAAAFLQ